jgi:hypothetical protein
VKSQAAKPFWSTQLGLYVRAAEAAATAANADDEGQRRKA